MLKGIHFVREGKRTRNEQQVFQANEEAQIVVTDGITCSGVSDLKSTKG